MKGYRAAVSLLVWAVIVWGAYLWLYPPMPPPVRGIPECRVMGGMVEWNLAKTEQVNRLVCVGVDDDYPYTIRVPQSEWEKWTATLGQRFPGE